MLISLSLGGARGQEVEKRLTRTIRGIVTDAASGVTIPFATISLAEMPEQVAVSDSAGRFVLPGVPVGRHTVRASYLGYDPVVVKEVMVSSAKETYLELAMSESVRLLNEVVVRPQVNKEQPLNKMATVGARMFSVEETARYAGSFDDPARLASSFSGVSSGGATNGISIHGNAPHLDMRKKFTNLVLGSSYNRKFSVRFTNKTGFTYTRMFYRMNMELAPYYGQPMQPVYDGRGNTGLLAASGDMWHCVCCFCSFHLPKQVTITICKATERYRL